MRGHLVPSITAFAIAAAGAIAADATSLTPFQASQGKPPAPWHVAGLPGQDARSKPFTEFVVVELDGRTAVRVDANLSFGNLVHPLAWRAPTAKLSWQWRVDASVDNADLRTRQGDDAALKVCVSFGLPLDQVPFVDRMELKVGQAMTTEPVPTATVCYVWDKDLPIGTELDNANSRRVRYVVLESGSAGLKQWKSENRDVNADFRKLFRDESPNAVPPITSVCIGADTDNTKSRSVGYVANITLQP